MSNVSVIGGDAPEYQIKLNPELMRLHNVSLDEVLAAAEGMNSNAGGGVIYEYGNEYIVKAELNTGDTEELGQAVVRSDENGIITLADIAAVEQGGRLPRLGTASVRTEPAVIITVTKQPAQGTIPLTENIDRELASLEKTLPPDVHVYSDIFRQSDFIENSIGNLRALAARRRAVCNNSALLLPHGSAHNAHLYCRSAGVDNSHGSSSQRLRHQHQHHDLGGIAIAIGCLVDDAIVDVENVYKRLRRNAVLPSGERKPVREVVHHASAEVRMPIFNSTLIIAAPLSSLFSFSPAWRGVCLFRWGVAFLIALAASTIVALTLTPVLCSYLLGAPQRRKSGEPKVAHALRCAYSRSLTGVWKHKKVLLGATGALFRRRAAVLLHSRTWIPSGF